MRFALARERGTWPLGGTVSADVKLPTLPARPNDFHESASLPSLEELDLAEPPNLWIAGGLTVVGTGIRGGMQTTPEVQARIEESAHVVYLVADAVTEQWIKRLRPTAESLARFYKVGASRDEMFAAVVEGVVAALRESGDVCAVFYGHPNVFANAGRESLRRARAEGFATRMLPGVSSLDNMFSDMELDPGSTGLQVYGATSFLRFRPTFDPTVGLTLLQPASLGREDWAPGAPPIRELLNLLRDRLLLAYPPSHPVILYEAADLPLGHGIAEQATVDSLVDERISAIATLYIPPLPRNAPDPEVEALIRSFAQPAP